MILPDDTKLRAGSTYTVTVQFTSDRSDVDLRMLVSDLSAAVLARIAADPVTATRVVGLSTAVRDDAVGPDTHEAVMKVRVVEEDLNLRVATLEQMYTAGFTSGSGNPLYPGVSVWRVSVAGDTGLSRSVAFALGAVVVFGGLYMLTRRKGTGMAKARGSDGIRGYGPGKFDTFCDKHVWTLSLDGADDEVSDDVGGGWIGLMRSPLYSKDDADAPELNRDEIDFLRKQVGAIVSEDSQGLVSVEYFTNKRSLNAEWKRILARAEEEMNSGGMAKARGRRLDPSLAETKLERVALKWLNETGKHYDDGAQGAFRDLMQGGISSGVVGGLIHYEDTVKFFRRYKDDIAAILRDRMEESGTRDPGDLFGDKWDEEDPFVEDKFNQNLLAWFGFEEAARNVALRAGFED